jgi:hypothetical protein
MSVIIATIVFDMATMAVDTTADKILHVAADTAISQSTDPAL